MAARVAVPNGTTATEKSPRQLVISAYATVPDVRAKVTLGVKTTSDSSLLFVDLAPEHAGLGGSALSVVLSQIGLEESVDVDSSKFKAAFTATQQMLAGGLLA